MKITIITVGKIKEKFLSDAINEYSKRLGKYAILEIIEVPDEKTDENRSQNEKKLVKAKEGNRILKYIKDNQYVITLEINGKMLDSIELSQKIESLGIEGKSNIVFIIGGSLGLDERISQRADFKLSFSKMTFPHQLMRVILLEQVYRAFKILGNETYHK